MFEHVLRTLHNFGLRPDVAQSEDQASKTLPIMMYVPIVIIPCPPDSFSDASTDAATDVSNIANCSDEMSDLCEEECTGHLVVRSTFLHMDDGHSLMQTYRKLRRAKTDFALMSDPEVYEPGKLSPANFRETHQQTQMQAPHFQPLQPLQPLKPVSDAHPCNGKQQAQETQIGKGKERTTVMLRNLPNNYTREMFLKMLDDHGLMGKYDFAYLPCDFYRDANLGYAFVNLVDGKAVDELWKIFHGFSDWALPTAKVCEVSWSGPHQGFKAHIERYRNSPVMHKSVPDEYKPVMFKNGVRKPFPRPTKKVKAPF